MSGPAFSLIVTDTAPLITLALANSLSALLRPGLPVSIPDAVYTEATRIRAAPGAEHIMDWINAHPEQVRVELTDIGLDQQRRLEDDRPDAGLLHAAAASSPPASMLGLGPIVNEALH